MRQVIRQVKFVDGQRRDIVVQDKRIVEITNDYEGEGKSITVPQHVYVSAGWIDIHTHAFPKFEPYCAYADDIGYKTGVTTVVDAGSSGYEDIDEFYEMKQTCHTRVFSFLNVSKIGLEIRNELEDLSLLDYEGIEKAFCKFPNMIVGLKARMSASVIGRNGITPLQMTKEFTKRSALPVMVHIGSAPPALNEVLDLLDAGDIVTHCFHEKNENHVFTDKPLIQQAVSSALQRGVYFDIGHGTSSFSFNSAKKAQSLQVPFHSISTDIYEKNQLYGPVYDLATTMTKFLALGYSLEKVICAVTENPAKMIRKKHLGKLLPGTLADLTFFTLEEGEKLLTDSFGNQMRTQKYIKPYATMIGGEYLECTATSQKSD